MQPYHLAKLIAWTESGELKSRKRIQKVVYLLQRAGCGALDAEFTLHHYGPYSQDVAALTDQMVSAGLLMEKAEPNQMVGSSYSYRLSDSAKKSLAQFEEEEPGRKMAADMQPFHSRATELLKTDLRKLEYAATAAYFYWREQDWKTALDRTCEFKEVKADGDVVTAAVELAKKFVECPNQA